MNLHGHFEFVTHVVPQVLDYFTYSGINLKNGRMAM